MTNLELTFGIWFLCEGRLKWQGFGVPTVQEGSLQRQVLRDLKVVFLIYSSQGECHSEEGVKALPGNP